MGGGGGKGRMWGGCLCWMWIDGVFFKWWMWEGGGEEGQ